MPLIKSTAKSCLYGVHGNTLWPASLRVDTTFSIPRRMGGCGRTFPSQLKYPIVSPPEASFDFITSASACLHGIGTTLESYFHGSWARTEVTNSRISTYELSESKRDPIILTSHRVCQWSTNRMYCLLPCHRVGHLSIRQSSM